MSEIDSVVEQLVSLLSSIVDERRAVDATTALIADLALESIQVIEYLCDVEDHFDLVIDEDSLADVRTVGDLAAVIVSLRNG
jgi:acyl carrier protein